MSISSKYSTQLEATAESKTISKMYTQAVSAMAEKIDKEIIARLIVLARHKLEEDFKELSGKETLTPEEEKKMSEVFADLL